MATDILMPALSPTMTEGTLSRWLKREGDAVKAGDVIAEIETDKATMEVEAVDEGVLGRILVPEGTAGVKVNAPIAVLVEDGEDPKAAAPKAAKAPAPAVASSPAAPAASAAPVVSAAPVARAEGGKRVFASPLARRIAKQNGIDLSGVHGSGPNGRIVRVDVEKAAQAGSTASAVAAPVSVAAAAAPAGAVPVYRPVSAPITAPHRAEPNSSMRKTIARRLSESKQFVPHFYVSMDIELDALLALRGQLNAQSPKDGDAAFKLSVNDMLVKAAAVALRRVPGVNASYTDEALIFYQDVDISVAVSVPDGLITPIVRQADRKGLAAISSETKDLITRARAGKLKPEEFQGGSFSISNMGMYGVKEFAAIINPPQGAILAIGAGEQRPVVKDGALSIATVMTCTLSLDHRVIDGALGAQWMQAFKAIVEQPLSLML